MRAEWWSTLKNEHFGFISSLLPVLIDVAFSSIRYEDSVATDEITLFFSSKDSKSPDWCTRWKRQIVCDNWAMGEHSLLMIISHPPTNSPFT